MHYFKIKTQCHLVCCVRTIKLFEDFNNTDLEQMLSLIEKRQYSKNSSIFHEGDLADRFFMVSRGSFKVFKTQPDGREQILYILSKGDVFGEMHLLKSAPYKFSATALEDTQLCTLTKVNFDNLLRQHPELSLKILSQAYDRIDALETLAQTLSSKDVDLRLATLLLKLSDQFGLPQANTIEIPIKLTREEMANWVGLTRETVSRKLSQFQLEGLICFEDNKTVRILDPDGLIKLCNKS